MNEIVIPEKILNELKEHLLKNKEVEGHAFLFGGYSNDKITVGRLWKTSDKSYIQRSSVLVDLKREYIIEALEYARQNNFAFIDVHSHPWSDVPEFSETDDKYGIENAEWIVKKSEEGSFPNIPWIMLLVSGTGKIIGRIYNSKEKNFIPLSIYTPINRKAATSIEEIDKKRYDRQIKLWGKEGQRKLQKYKIGIIGLGGLGAVISEMLARIGINNFYLFDADKVEDSNLTRLIGFYSEHIGYHKVDIVKMNIKHINPLAKVQIYKEYFSRKHFSVLCDKIDLLIGCVDREGARLLANEFSVRYLIPYIDIGSGIHINEEKQVKEMGAQIRFVNPGTTPCLACYSKGIDPVEAVFDLTPDRDMEVRRNLGYIEGTSQSPTPSVLPLNNTIASIAVQIIANLITGFKNSIPPYIHLNTLDFQINSFSDIEPQQDCPVCGIGGFLGLQDKNQVYITKDEMQRLNILTNLRVKKNKK